MIDWLALFLLVAGFVCGWLYRDLSQTSDHIHQQAERLGREDKEKE